MRYFFKLQYKMLCRHLSDFGVHPLIGFGAIGLLFYSLSATLFNQSIYAEYFYAILFFIIIIKLSSSDRVSFFKAHFNTNYRLKIRLIENNLVAIPFLVVLIQNEKFITASGLLLIAVLFSFMSTKTRQQVSIPTPFYKQPFEFLIGFRKNWILLIILYLISYIGIYVGNFNLSVVTLIAVVLCSTSFFTQLETPFYVWIFSFNPKEFLDYKIQLIIKYILIICLPITLPLLLFCYENTLLILGIQCLGILLVITTMLGKYAVFPSKISLQQTLAIMLCVMLPPILLLIIPYFYNQSKKRLNSILQ